MAFIPQTFCWEGKLMIYYLWCLLIYFISFLGTDTSIPLTTKTTVRRQVLQIYNSMGCQARLRYNVEINKFFEEHRDDYIEIQTGQSLDGIGKSDDILVYLRGRLILVSGYHIAMHFLEVHPYSCKICGEELAVPTGFHFDSVIVRIFLQHTRDLICPLYTLSDEVGFYNNDFFDRENRASSRDVQVAANMPRLVDYSDSEEEEPRFD